MSNSGEDYNQQKAQNTPTEVEVGEDIEIKVEVEKLLPLSAREGGDQRERTDRAGRTYYEVFAEFRKGNRGGSVPFYAGGGGGQWARQVTVDTRDQDTGQWSHWFISSDNKAVYGDGTGPGTEGRTPDRNSDVPGLRKWALVARWVAVDNFNGGISAISGWFYVGLNRTIDVPIPGRIVPTPIGGSYNPLVQLQYLCNDDDHNDNGGWLHIYETWSR